MAAVSNPSETLRRAIIKEAKRLGANLVGFAPVERWETCKDTPPAFYPQNIWPEVKTVIVLGIQIFIPMLDTTPSAVYAELYNTVNRATDDMAYYLANFINTRHKRAFFFPRDCYGDAEVLLDNPVAAFSHVLAAKYAGLGTVGRSHNLLTKEFGPRVRLVSVLTDAVLPPDEMRKEDLCIKCNLCQKCCPTQSFSANGDELLFAMDMKKCTEYHIGLAKRLTYPCGVCTKVCPVGEDRKVYGMDAQKYLGEQEALDGQRDASAYRGWVHCRSYGSWPAK